VKSLYSKAALLLIAMVMCFAALSIKPSYAAERLSGSGGTGIIDITGGTGGITIKPGNAPDMTDVDSYADNMGEKVISKGKTVAQTVTAICTIICFVMFFISVTQLATSSSNPIMRYRALLRILWSGIAITLFGGSWVVVTFFWNFLT